MARKAFYSFHYQPDCFRAAQVRNMGMIEGDPPCSDNDWEAVTKGGDSAIERWISQQMSGKSAVIVLVGADTAGRKWITREIIKGWNEKKGVVGIHIHNLLHKDGKSAVKGMNPFASIRLGDTGPMLSSVVKSYDPAGHDSRQVYDTIRRNLADWVEEAIRIRNAA
jgi:hypothetical protein